MNSLGRFGAVARQATRASLYESIPICRAKVSQRYLKTETAPTLYSVTALATGGRNGRIEGSEGLQADLATPKPLGGPGGQGMTNAEELFAASYGACFQSAMNLSAKSIGVKLPVNPGDIVVETTLRMVGNIQELDLSVRLAMKVKAKGISRNDLERVVEKTKMICPYLRAVKGNVHFDVVTETM